MLLKLSSDNHSKYHYNERNQVLALSETRPLLIRSISRKSKNEYIANFTNSAYAAERLGERKGF